MFVLQERVHLEKDKRVGCNVFIRESVGVMETTNLNDWEKVNRDGLQYPIEGGG